jgi:predicted DNA-binding protein
MPLSLRLDPELESRINAYCAQTGMSKSKLISLGVKDYLDTHATPTLYELAKDLLPEPKAGASDKSETRASRYRDYVKRKHAARSSARR